MTWGPYWMFYRCKPCGKLFKQSLDTIADPHFGECPACGKTADLEGESKAMPAQADEYETV